MVSDPTGSFSRPRVAAGVLFFDRLGRVMMVVPSYKDYLDIPGGYIEHGETPTRAAAREVKEELGITPPIGRLLVIDWAPTPPRATNSCSSSTGECSTRGGWTGSASTRPS